MRFQARSMSQKRQCAVQFSTFAALLRDVSRSFYLTLRVLPAAIRAQMGLAYLLARATDTIADTEIIAVDRRLAALEAFRQRILGTARGPLDFGEFALHQGLQGERRLLERSEEILRGLASFSAADQERIRTVLEIITGGQELDLNRFGGASDQKIVSLKTDLEFDDYTYRVAGCVGEFWTKMCRTHLFPKASLDDSRLLANGIRFGKGLQLINILRDVPADVRRGRCYVPEELLGRHGLTPTDLLSAANDARFRPAYADLLQRAEDHLEAGWTYTNTLPRRCARVRLACAWSILIGVKTLQKLRTSQVLAARQPIKISRVEVRRLMWRSVLYYPITPAWKNLFQSAGRPTLS